MTDPAAKQDAKPTLGPWEIWGEDEMVPGVPSLEIGRGEGGTPSCKTICYVDCTLDDETDKFSLTPEDHANANLIATAPDTAAERDRLLVANVALAEALKDMFSGWRYIRQEHGDLPGVGWDRVENKVCAALKAHGPAPEGDKT